MKNLLSDYLSKLHQLTETCPLNRVTLYENGKISHQMISAFEIPNDGQIPFCCAKADASPAVLQTVLQSANDFKNKVYAAADKLNRLSAENSTGFAGAGQLVGYCNNYCMLLEEEYNGGGISFARYKDIFSKTLKNFIVDITDYLYTNNNDSESKKHLIRLLECLRDHLKKAGAYTPSVPDNLKIDYNNYSADFTDTDNPELHECIREIRIPSIWLDRNKLTNGSAIIYRYIEK